MPKKLDAKSKSRKKRGPGRAPGQRPAQPNKLATTVRRLLVTRQQTAHMLGGISIMSVIRLENDGKLRKVRLSSGPTSQVFNLMADVVSLTKRAEA